MEAKIEGQIICLVLRTSYSTLKGQLIRGMIIPDY